jgi:hypothetical protein
MKVKLIIIILIAGGLLVGGYLYYQYNYVKTLMLSEIVGKTDNDVVNILVNLSDFDTGLTRRDLKKLKSQKEYWINRMNEVNNITNPELREQANLKLISDMTQDPTMKKVCKIITVKGFGFAVNMLETIL